MATASSAFISAFPYLAVDSNQIALQALADKAFFDFNGLGNDLLNEFRSQFVGHKEIEVAGKVSMEALITADKLVAEGKSRHE